MRCAEHVYRRSRTATWTARHRLARCSKCAKARIRKRCGRAQNRLRFPVTSPR